MKNEAYLPLQEPTFYIMLALRAGERHGYAILKDVDALSAGRVLLSTGTLYGALNRLLDQGLIERIESSDQEGSRGKKCYRLSERGLAVFAAELERMQHLLRAAQITAQGRAQV